MLHQSTPNVSKIQQDVAINNDSRPKLINKAPKRRSSALKFFTSNSPPKHDSNHHQTHKEWEAEYLKKLRTDRPARPSGSRPPPEKMAVSEPYARAASALSLGPSLINREEVPKATLHERATSALSHRRAQSDMQRLSYGGSLSGRALARPPDVRQSMGDFARPVGSPKAASDSTPMPYHEDGLRWVEKQEARALREAMEEMEVREEAKVHANAQEEASQLVWQHMNGHAPPDSQPGRRNYREHLREGSHARSLSKAWGKQEYSPEQAANSHGKHVTDGRDTNNTSQMAAKELNTPAVDGSVDDTNPRVHIKWDSPEKKAYTNLAFQGSRIDKGRRRSSGTKKRNSSGGPFKNPDDQIYEDVRPLVPVNRASHPQRSHIVAPLAAQSPDSSTNTNVNSRHFVPSTRIPTMKSSNLHRSRTPEALAYDQNHRNPQSGNHEGSAENRNQLEIRSDEIRSATSKRLKDRSPKLPMPAFISGKPGQHIVSFDKEWKPKDQKDPKNGGPDQGSISHKRPPIPAVTTSAPIVPTINVSSSALEDMSATQGAISEVPLISVSEGRPPSHDSQKLQSKHIPASRSLPHHSSTTPARTSNTHWSPMPHRTTAQCAACALPIAGRVVTAASQRFHPGCFNCHHCQTALECVAFYPEPENKRSERVARIQSRIDGEETFDDQPGETAEDDGDESLRFYCHLDFHELFSPRCRSCKTPIESEVIVACGGTWHVGHFFCAECGDPFDPKTPFVEKDGYAWCVKCHAGRFSGKCKGCRKPVVEAGINALGAEWHESCFVCVECSGGFEDGRFFTRGEDQKPVCVGCEERRLKA